MTRERQCKQRSSEKWDSSAMRNAVRLMRSLVCSVDPIEPGTTLCRQRLAGIGRCLPVKVLFFHSRRHQVQRGLGTRRTENREGFQGLFRSPLSKGERKGSQRPSVEKR